jgi:hypothetical protein
MDSELLHYNCNCAAAEAGSPHACRSTTFSQCISTLSKKSEITAADMVHAKSISTWIVTTLKDPQTTSAALSWHEELEKLHLFHTQKQITRKVKALRKAHDRINTAERALQHALRGASMRMSLRA